MTSYSYPDMKLFVGEAVVDTIDITFDVDTIKTMVQQLRMHLPSLYARFAERRQCHSRGPATIASEFMRVCVHEAGHAIAGLVLGERITSVQVDADTDTGFAGAVWFERVARPVNRRAIILCAGVATEQLLMGRATGGYDADLREVLDITIGNEAWRNNVWKHASLIVRHERRLIAALARQLFATSHMTGQEVWDFIVEHDAKPARWDHRRDVWGRLERYGKRDAAV